MIRTALSLPFVLVAAAPLTAQSGDLHANAVVLVQFGAGDVVLNDPLLNAIMREPELHQQLVDAFGEALAGQNVVVRLPAPHLAGTFQIHVETTLQLRGPRDEARRKLAIDTVLAHLQRRLTTLLHARPEQELQDQRAALQDRHGKLLARRSELLSRKDAAICDAADLRKLRASIAEQRMAARLEVATEERAAQHLQVQRAEQTAKRDALRRELDRRAAEVAEGDVRLAQMRARIEALITSNEDIKVRSEEIKRLRADIDAVEAEQRLRRSQVDSANEALADAQRLLGVVLEQLPASALCQQRATSRFESLAAAQKEIDERGDRASALQAEATRFAVEAEQLQIEASVCTTMLVEVQGKLARLRPLGWQVLHER